LLTKEQMEKVKEIVLRDLRANKEANDEWKGKSHRWGYGLFT
jgi:hypothetical protein